MMTTIEIKITNQGKAFGTVGWLAEHAASIHLGKTKDGSEGAWLCDADGKTITALAIRGYWNPTEIETLARETAGGVLLGAEIPWTDAGWEAVSRLAEIAVEAIDAKLARDDDSEAPVALVA